MRITISPSLLSANFCSLEEDVNRVAKAGADRLHIDVMDGHFVPNITIGPMVVKALRPVTQLPFDVHLMIENPDLYLDDFALAGADLLYVHIEACRHLHRTLQHISELGKRSAVALNPATPIGTLECVLDHVDRVLVMSVNPGFGGQTFLPLALDKIRSLRQMAKQRKIPLEIEVDGGITVENIGIVARAGADIIVSGTGVFKTEDYQETIMQMRQAVKKACSER